MALNKRTEFSAADQRTAHLAKTLGLERSLTLNPLAVVKIEFGNSAFDTRQTFPGEIRVGNDALMVDLRPDQVQCKAIGRSGSCGTTETGEECCSPSPSEKPEGRADNPGRRGSMYTRFRMLLRWYRSSTWSPVTGKTRGTST